MALTNKKKCIFSYSVTFNEAGDKNVSKQCATAKFSNNVNQSVLRRTLGGLAVRERRLQRGGGATQCFIVDDPVSI